MALQGTIDTFDLTEVIRMLAAGSKTGRLGLSGDRGSGSVWFSDGEIVASETDSTDLASDHAAVLFQLLRFAEGSFVFDQDAVPSSSDEPVEADPVIDEAMQRLEEWSEIEAVVPSLEHQVTLRAELARSDVVVDQQQWRALAAIGGGASVGALGRCLQEDELDVSRTVRDLVELGLTEVGDPIDGGLAEEPAADELPSTGPVGFELPDDVDDEFAVIDVDEPGSDGGHTPEESTGPDAESWADAEDDFARDLTDDPVDPGARGQLDALASGFGLTDPAPPEPAAESGPPPGVETELPPLDLGDTEDFADPAPLPGADEEGAGTFPIEMAEAAGEATTPLFAHDDDTAADPAGDVPPPAPGEAAEVARQLANLSPEAARAVAAAARATTDEEREAALAQVAEDGEEPIDPDLLRSFLSSVKR